MLSSPGAKGSKGQRFGLGAAANGCEAEHDLVLARARETKIDPSVGSPGGLPEGCAPRFGR